MNLTCPHCLTDHNAISSLDGRKEAREPTLCNTCGAWTILDKDGLRYPTAQEYRRIAKNPVCRAVHNFWGIRHLVRA